LLTAQAATASLYKPLLLGSNLLYILLLASLNVEYTWKNILGIILAWGLQAYAYVGILDQAANATGQNKALVGGANLDLLALTLVVQYGSVLHSTKWYLLLVIAPIWGAWSLYSTFGGGKKGEPAPARPEVVSDEVKERRQKRAERRRQKRY